jgi:hypothetical protein
VIAQMFRAIDEPLHGVRLQPVNQVGPGFARRLLALAPRRGHDTHRMDDGPHRTLLPHRVAPRRYGALRELLLVRAAAAAACTNTVRKPRWPVGGLPDVRFPAPS